MLYKHGEGKSTFFTTSDLWECDCEKRFVHLKDEDECRECGSLRSESPGGRILEIMTKSKFSKQAMRILKGLE